MALNPIDGLEPLEDDGSEEQEQAVEEQEQDALEAIDLEDSDEPVGSTQIQMFGKASRHDEQWQRKPNVTGQGAIHCRTFHAKLREDALEFMDKQINEWLDAHPEYEVKMVTSSVGELKSKLVEPALFLTVWV